ncbi:MAG: ribonuclease III [Nitrospirae bacterium]|nr:ribonuclease III [Nitrospirota bacterium]
MRDNLDCSRQQELQSFQKLVGYSFRDVKLLDKALTHRSFAHERIREDTEYNQRLEFLGDAILGMVVSEYLYHRFPQYLEGKLSKMKSMLVNGTLLVCKAKEIQLGQYFLLGRGEESTGGRDRTSLLADGFEALIGSIYLDGGLSVCRRFILERLQPELEKLELDEVEEKDYKSNLQEYAQAGLGQVPFYQVVSTQGPSHQKIFEVTVSLQGKVYGKGQGGTKKSAEQQAARQALEKLKEKDK